MKRTTTAALIKNEPSSKKTWPLADQADPASLEYIVAYFALELRCLSVPLHAVVHAVQQNICVNCQKSSVLPLKHGFCSHCKGLRPCFYCQRAANDAINGAEPGASAKVWYPEDQVMLLLDPNTIYIYMCPAHQVLMVEQQWPRMFGSGHLEDWNYTTDELFKIVKDVLLERGEEVNWEEEVDYEIQEIDYDILNIEEASNESLHYLGQTLQDQLELAEAEPVGRPRIYCNNCQAHIIDAEARCFAVADQDPDQPMSPENELVVRRQLGYRKPDVWSWNLAWPLQRAERVLHNFLIFEEDVFLCDRCDDDPLTDDSKRRLAKPELYNPEWDAGEAQYWDP